MSWRWLTCWYIIWIYIFIYIYIHWFFVHCSGIAFFIPSLCTAILYIQILQSLLPDKFLSRTAVRVTSSISLLAWLYGIWNIYVLPTDMISLWKKPLNYEIDIICFNLSGAEVWIFLERTKADDTLVLWVTRSLAARVFYTLWCP